MGVRNGPATFQRLMELALSGLQCISCLVYLDDILVYGKSFDEHLRRLAAVIQRFREAVLKLKPSKCTFFQKEVKFLGHLINGKGAYCSTVLESTGLTPNMMMLGREVRTVTDLICGVHQQVTTPIGSEYVMALCNKMQVAHDIAQVH